MSSAAGGSEPSAAALVDELRRTVRSGVTRDSAWRQEQLRSIVRMVVERQQELYDALSKDLGRPLGASASEVLSIKDTAEDAIKSLPEWVRPRPALTPTALQPAESEIVPEPYGVVLIIGPWNFPVMLCLEPLIGAIAAGNAVVLKPSEVAPHCAAALGSALEEYLDNTAVRVVQGGPETAVKLLEQKWDKVFFTGGTEIGRKVAVAAAKHLTPVTLELGGRNPAYIDETADLESACQLAIWGATLNAGQVCLKPEYVLAHRSLVPKVLDTLKETVTKFFGEDSSKSRDLCRIVSDRHFDRLMGLLAEPGVAKSIVCGGKGDREERLITPTVLFDVPWDSKVMQEETFGPILAVQPVDSLEEAIGIINDKPKPLVLHVFSAKEEVVEKFILETSSGAVLANETIMHFRNPHLPFGGVGDSGMGSYRGKYSFYCFSHDKAVLKRDIKANSAARYPPSTQAKDEKLRAFLLRDK